MDRPAGRRAMRPGDSIISLMVYLMAVFRAFCNGCCYGEPFFCCPLCSIHRFTVAASARAACHACSSGWAKGVQATAGRPAWRRRALVQVLQVLKRL